MSRYSKEVTIPRVMYFARCSYCEMESKPMETRYSNPYDWWTATPINEDPDKEVLLCPHCVEVLFEAKPKGPDIDMVMP